MRSEEPLEDGKLSTVKSWFSRSVSSISSQNGSVDAAADGNSYSVAVSKEGVLESGPGFTPLKQLSMRRSRPSGEVEKELGTGSPSMTPRNITPLTPLTPLRWKSSPREQEEEEKAMERSRFGMPRDEEDEPRGKAGVANGNGTRRIAERQQQQVGGPAALDRTKSVDELPSKAQAGNVDDLANVEPTEGLDRKQSSVDDVMTMTIEFLRARLLSERAASRAAKMRVQQLATKVSDLERKLDQATADRKKAEVAAEEVFMKLKLAESSNQAADSASGEVSDRYISNSTKGSPLAKSRAGREDTKYLHQEMSSNEDLSRTNSIESSIEDRDTTTKNQLPESVSKVEGRSAEQGRSAMRSPLRRPHMADRSEESPVKQDSRAAIESRLRNMWTKISEEMSALADGKTEEDVVQQELTKWMGQVPSVLRDIIPKKLVSSAHDTGSSDSKLVDARQELPPNSQPRAAKRGSQNHNEFAAQKNSQEEWDRKYHESHRKFEGVDSSGLRSPRASAGHHSSDYVRGQNGGADDPADFRSPRTRLAKSKSDLDLPMRPGEYNSEMNVPYRDGPSVEPDSWNRMRSQKQGTDGRRYQNTAAQRSISFESNHQNHEAWSERQPDQEYYQDTGNRGGHSSFAQRGSSEWPSTNRSADDVFWRSHPDFRPRQSTWDDGDRRNSSGPPQQVQLGDSGREESYASPHPESTHQHRHRHRRSHSNNDDWPAVDDYGMLDQHPEPSPGLGRRQSYSGYPAPSASDPSRSSYDNGLGSYGDPRYSDERMNGARGQRRESFPISKAGQQYSSPAGRNGSSNPEPMLSLGYGPGYDAPRDGSPVQPSPKAGSNKNISDVLRALQMAKANIQNGGAGAKDARLNGDQAQYRQASRQAMPEQFRQPESQGPSRRSSLNPRYDPYEADSGSDRYQSEGDVSNSTGAETSYADQLNVGKGIQFFFP